MARPINGDDWPAPEPFLAGCRRAGRNDRQGHRHVKRGRARARRPEIGRAHAELQSLMRISYAVFCLTKKTIFKAQITLESGRIKLQEYYSLYRAEHYITCTYT